MALQCGIVGLPNVGKSTLFNCLSNAKAQAANFPFCTIEPNVGVITVPDERLIRLPEIHHPPPAVPPAGTSPRTARPSCTSRASIMPAWST